MSDDEDECRSVAICVQETLSRHSKWRKSQTTRGFVSIGRVLLGAEQLRQDAYHPHKCAIPATPPPAGRGAAAYEAQDEEPRFFEHFRGKRNERFVYLANVHEYGAPQTVAFIGEALWLFAVGRPLHTESIFHCPPSRPPVRGALPKGVVENGRGSGGPTALMGGDESVGVGVGCRCG